MTKFSVPRPNLYQASSGFSLEVLGRTGLRYTEGDHSMFIDSEVLAPPSGIVIYKDTIHTWQAPHDAELLPESARTRILENVIAALRSQDVPVDVV